MKLLVACLVSPVALGVLLCIACSTPCPRTAPKGAGVGTVRPLPGNLSVTAVFLGSPSESQPDSGKPISCLRSFRGKVFAGYGDWTENTGPILVVSYDPIDHEFDCGPELSTEAIDVMRVIGERLVVPEVDYSGWFWFHSDVHFFDGEQWSSVRLPRAIHVFDVAQFQGRLYVAYQYNPKEDTDRMHRVAVFENGRLVNPKVLEQGRHGRIYRLVACGERLYAFPERGPGAYVYDGSGWHSWNGPVTGRRFAFRTETDGKQALVIVETLGRNAAFVIDDAGRGRVVDAFRNPVDVKRVEKVFYVLDRLDSGKRATLFRSGNLVEWEPVLEFEAESPPTAMETLEGFTYVGLENGELWRLEVAK